jgi:hypothetical protein
MTRTTTIRLLTAIPAFGLAAVAVAFVGGAFGPDPSPAFGALPPKADAVASAPEGLSPATTARDWQEVKGSRNKKKWR